jgi:sugar O-acyltransferase (sialic acid O-acetyltransferase NeuD family)
MENPVLIFGANALGKAVLDIFNRNNVLVYGFLDEDKTKIGTEINDVTILGEPDDDGFLKLIGHKCEAFIAIESKNKREDLIDLLNERRKVQPVNAIHDKAIISEDAAIGHGNYIGAGVVVNTFAVVENHCLIHTSATIEFEAVIKNLAQIGTGAVIGAGAIIEEGAFVGSGAIIVGGITVGKNARVGAGSVVVENVPAKATVFGNPAKKI